MSVLAASRSGIIAHELRCFDFEGEWANFRGFDMLAVAGAAAVAAALYCRSIEGGSYQVRVSLTRMCMWAQEIGLLDAAALDGTRAWADPVAEADLPLEHIESPFGDVSYLPTLIGFDDFAPHFVSGSQPLGSSPISWAVNE